MSDAAASPWTAPAVPPVLPGGEIHVVAFALDPPAPRLAQLERVLARDELERAARFHQARARRRYVARRAQLRAILGGYLSRDPGELEFSYGAHGKPALRGGGRQERVRFSLSHSDELALVALQLDDEVGIDLERIRPFPDALDIAQRFFAPDEYAALCALPAAERDAAFFGYWTRKEAVIKSMGRGLSQPLASFTLAPHAGAEAERVVVADEGGVMVRWLLPVPPASAGFLAALATAGAARPVRCWRWPDP